MSKYVSYAALALAVVASPSLALAQENADEIVVTATRAPQGLPRDQLGGSVTLLSSEDLELRQTQVVSDVVRDVPGIAVSRGGGVGGLTAVRIRGAEGNHTLVMIDGMDVSDVFQQEFDFATLIADDLSRVEVLRGQQSALYGSDAIGGVVHYITATGREASGARGRVEYGSFNTGQLSARLAGVNGPFDWAVSGNAYNTDGAPNVVGGVRDLAFDSETLAGRFGVAVTDDLSLTAVLRARNSHGDFNEDTDFDGFNDDTPGAYFDDEARYGLIRADLSTFNGALTHALIVQRAEGDRFNNNTTFPPDRTEGERTKASYIATLHFGGDGFDQNLTGAIDYRDESYESTNIIGDRNINQTGVVLDYNALINDHLGLGLAARHDENSEFEGATTYRVQASYAFDTGTRLRGAYGTGIKNPTMSELFGFFGTFEGNPSLTPEESQGWEIGIEQYLLDRDLLVGVTYFDNELTDKIGTESTGTGTRPANTPGESSQRGVEVFAQANFGPQWAVDFAYTYLDAEEPDGSRAVRRAENIASANVSWRTAGDRGGVNLNVRYNGEQGDNRFLPPTYEAAPVTLDAFTLVTLGADWRLTEGLQVYGRVENALDEDYQEVVDFASPERAYYVGLRAGF
jgi:vitamin B12 transporter